MKQPFAGNPCLPLTPFLCHTGPGSWPFPNCLSLAPPQAQNVPPAPLWPEKQVWALWASLHHFTPWTRSVCEIKTAFTMMAWIWAAVWGEWGILGVFWGLFLSRKWSQQEADRGVRGVEAQHTPCSSPGNHSTARAAPGWWPLLWKSGLGRCNKSQSALGTTETKKNPSIIP